MENSNNYFYFWILIFCQFNWTLFGPEFMFLLLILHDGTFLSLRSVERCAASLEFCSLPSSFYCFCIYKMNLSVKPAEDCKSSHADNHVKFDIFILSFVSHSPCTSIRVSLSLSPRPPSRLPPNLSLFVSLCLLLCWVKESEETCRQLTEIDWINTFCQAALLRERPCFTFQTSFHLKESEGEWKDVWMCCLWLMGNKKGKCSQSIQEDYWERM